MKYLQVAGIDQLDSMLGQFVAQRLGKVGAYQRQLWVIWSKSASVVRGTWVRSGLCHSLASLSIKSRFKALGFCPLCFQQVFKKWRSPLLEPLWQTTWKGVGIESWEDGKGTIWRRHPVVQARLASGISQALEKSIGIVEDDANHIKCNALIQSAGTIII